MEKYIIEGTDEYQIHSIANPNICMFSGKRARKNWLPKSIYFNSNNEIIFYVLHPRLGKNNYRIYDNNKKLVGTIKSLSFFSTNYKIEFNRKIYSYSFDKNQNCFSGDKCSLYQSENLVAKCRTNMISNWSFNSEIECSQENVILLFILITASVRISG
jgi:hypothetical protein